MWLYWYFLKTMASYNPTSLTPSPFTEVPVLSQDSERSCICVLGISNLPISFILICSLFLWYFQLKSTILREVSDCPQAPKRYCSDLQYFFWRPCWPVHHNSFFTTYNKMKTKNITLSEKVNGPWGTSEIHGPFLGSPIPVPMHRMNPLSKALVCITLNYVNPVLYPSIDTILCVLLNMPAASATAKISFSVQGLSYGQRKCANSELLSHFKPKRQCILFFHLR
jgi:hypothetical protein